MAIIDRIEALYCMVSSSRKMALSCIKVLVQESLTYRDRTSWKKLQAIALQDKTTCLFILLLRLAFLFILFLLLAG